MNNGIRYLDHAAPDMPHGILGKPTPTRMPRGRSPRFNYDPSNLVLVFDTSLEPGNLTVAVPTQSSPNVIIDWGDGSSEAVTTGNVWIAHTYAQDGIYVVQVSGRMGSLNFGTANPVGRPKVVRCLSFGDIGLTQISLRGCANLIEVPSVLPITVTLLNSLFRECPAINDQNLTKWDTSRVTNFESAFHGCSAFNQPIGGWDTSAATTMSNMFVSCPAFNQPIGNWNTSKVTSFAGMFQSATSFNQQIGGWETSSATNMATMFSSATSFRQTIMGWNVSNVSSIFQVFVNSRYDQDVSAWDIRRVTTFTSSFAPQWGNANYSAALIAWAALPDDDLKTQAITAFAASGGSTLVTSNAHGMVAGSRVNISGTTNYNGDYNVATASANSFTIPVAFVANDATGTMKHRRSRGVTLNVGTVKYTAAAASARATLINDYGWIITDGGQE